MQGLIVLTGTLQHSACWGSNIQFQGSDSPPGMLLRHLHNPTATPLIRIVCLLLSLPFQGTMPCCSSCGLAIQGHQVPTGAKCSILFDEATHMSGIKPECTVCQQSWGSHLWGKHIPKDCKFLWQQAPGDTITDGLEPAEDGDVHSRLAQITQENQAIKAQLSQLTELVWQLLPQPGQFTLQPARAGNILAPAPPGVDQAASTSGVEASLPPPSWPHSGDSAPGVTPGDLQLLPPSHAGQHSALPHSNSLPAVPAAVGSPARQGAATDATLQQLWPSPVSPSTLVLGSTSSPQQVSSAAGLPLAQVPASLWGKIQWGEYVDLSKLLVYDFQYWYSGLDDSQALEIVDGKLSLASKCRARYLSTLQLWLWAWHLYKDAVLSFFPHRYLELSHYWHHISDLDQHFHWAAMLSYDAQFKGSNSIRDLLVSLKDKDPMVSKSGTTYWLQCGDPPGPLWKIQRAPVGPLTHSSAQ